MTPEQARQYAIKLEHNAQILHDKLEKYPDNDTLKSILELTVIVCLMLTDPIDKTDFKFRG